MKYQATSRSVPPLRRWWSTAIAVLCVAALAGLAAWFAASSFRTSDGATVQTDELTAAQHTAYLVRDLRIQATHNTTSDQTASIPASAADLNLLACDSRYTQALEPAVVRLQGLSYVSTIGGARHLTPQTWRTQQHQAQDSAAALQRLFPSECAPVIPVVYDVPAEMRSANGIALRQLLRLSDDFVHEWSQLYLLAETPAERELALAGLRQVTTWEAAWGPGRSPFALQ